MVKVTSIEDVTVFSDDDDDWVELERVATPAAAPAKVGMWRARKKFPNSPVKASIFLCGEAADALSGLLRKADAFPTKREDGPPLVKVAIGGPQMQWVRIRPVSISADRTTNTFNVTGSVAFRIAIGVVNVWPSEERPSTPAQFEIVGGDLVLKLPDDWAKIALPASSPKIAPTNKSAPKAVSPIAEKAAPPKAQPPVSKPSVAPVAFAAPAAPATPSPAKASPARPGPAKPVTYQRLGFPGDPAPGRSALDQKKARGDA